MLLSLFKNNFVFQNAASWFVSRMPCMVEHNLQKYQALKKAFYLTALEQLEGDYLEFGVFTGSSFVFAVRIHRRLRELSKAPTRFYGFDSFSGFGKVTDADRHPFYQDNIFSISAEKVERNIRRKAGKHCETRIVKGFFEETLAGKTPASYGIGRARIVFIDCDLQAPAALALEFSRPSLQTGTILILDDFLSYRGATDRGVTGAFNAFSEKYPEIKWRKAYDYGYGGAVFIASEVKS